MHYSANFIDTFSLIQNPRDFSQFSNVFEATNVLQKPFVECAKLGFQGQGNSLEQAFTKSFVQSFLAAFFATLLTAFLATFLAAFLATFLTALFQRQSF